tara:strand:+ start:225 stop:491 length:267 start_codon:yes stop_codon:yes gene_type:complete
MSSPEQHHELGPSTLKYVEICPSYRSSNETNIFAEEGTMLHSAAETGDLSGLDEEQLKQVVACLDYIKPMEDVADEVHKELRTEIRHG